MEEEEEAPVHLVTNVNIILRSFLSDVELYINSWRTHNSNVVHAHKPYITNNFEGAISEYKGA